MYTRVLSAALSACLILLAATAAEARIDTGIISSTYDEGQARPSLSKNFKSERKTYAERRKGTRVARKSARKTYAKANLKSRAVTAGNEGGAGTSRSCLQPEARALLSRIESQFGAVSIVSTCRPGAVIAGSGKPSKHRYGLAIDFDAGGRKGAIVNWLIQNHHSGGTMTYANMSHIHVDVGPKFVSLNAGGRRRG